ncbi:MAG: anti-sigma F factor [Oscillospiraceae bacterium]|jgi:stage II sporulation protein AB (anti-sigma F factor)|nr:anti-sigma F factor [Oscillospiraceae bacterium]MBQ2144713.1 anti-sigma F factor [Oscillospiraceae bacterium]MBQ2203736.1 anti-sigma F factor [Oscillospiraceae bacterium]MBQ2328382.1 anti-sigma F factor [Oscillospiraceae bacterium]MBQ5467890.1 anti-sigma F factor [Oscillospiraceae bacterium]
MKHENEAVVRFPSLSRNEAFARSVTAAFAAQMDPTIDELNDVKTAVSEAVTNAIVHAYPDRVGPVTLRLRRLEENVLEITVKDLGCGIEDVAKARQPMFTTGGADRSGMGMTIMESFMNALSIRSRPGRGTTVRMKKKLVGRGDPDCKPRS